MTLPAPLFELPRFLQKGRGETLDFPVYSGSSAVAPVSATFSLLDADGVLVVNAAAATIAAGAATYALPSTFADAYTLPQTEWRERWVLTGLSGAPSPMTFERTALVCRVAPVPSVTAESLFRMHPTWRRLLPAARTSYDEPITQAWDEMIGRLLGDGHLPNRILNWFALGIVHRYWAAHIVCRDFQTDQPGDSRWARLSDEYWKRSQDEYEHHLGLQADSTETGVADTPGALDPAEPQLFLTDLPWSSYPSRRGDL